MAHKFFPTYSTSGIVQPKKHSFNYWWNTPVETNEKREWLRPDGTEITHGMYVKMFYRNLYSIITRNGYTIKDEKQFKNDLTLFIYKLSHEHNV